MLLCSSGYIYMYIHIHVYIYICIYIYIDIHICMYASRFPSGPLRPPLRGRPEARAPGLRVALAVEQVLLGDIRLMIEILHHLICVET